MNDLVVKSNKLITALQTLTLVECRLLQLAIVDARESGQGLTTDKPLSLDAQRYSKAFDVTPEAAYMALVEAEESLFKRQFTILKDDGTPLKSHWLQDTNYRKGEGKLQITLTRLVIENITRLDGFEQYFTAYRLNQTSNLSSIYAVRLYELLIQWQSIDKTPMFELAQFRSQLGIGVNEYQRMERFKSRVLEPAITQINTHTDITVSYEQHKAGRIISGFSFTCKAKKKTKPAQEPTPKTKKPLKKEVKEDQTDWIQQDIFQRFSTLNGLEQEKTLDALQNRLKGAKLARFKVARAVSTMNALAEFALDLNDVLSNR